MKKRTKRKIGFAGDMNEYLEGRVRGIITGVTRDTDKMMYATYRQGDTTIIPFDATDKEFETVVDILITLYGRRRNPMLKIVEFLP